MSASRSALMPVMSASRGALMPVMSASRGALMPVMSVNDRRGALMPVMSVDVICEGFIAKADVVTTQDAAKAIRLNFMVWTPLYFEKGIGGPPRNGDPYR